MAEFPSWQQGLRQSYSRLRGAARADAAIVGGGFTGVLTALMLQQNGVNTVLVERDILGHGETFGCGGMVSCQAAQVYRQIARSHSLDAARVYAQLMQEAVVGLSEMARTVRSAQLTERSVYLYAETEDDLPALESLLTLENELGLKVSVAPDAGGCPFPVELSCVLHHQYTLAPLPFLLHLANCAVHHGCRIFEHTPVIARHGTHLHTPEGTVDADTVIFCTGMPPDCRDAHVLELMKPRLMETRVLRQTAPLHTVQYSVQPDEPAFRPVHNTLLMTLDRGRYGTRDIHTSRVIRDRTLRALLPEAVTTDVILRRAYFTRDALPLIGPVEPQHSRALMAGGYNAHGLTGGFLAAKMLCAQVLGCAENHSSLFLPFRDSTPRPSALVRPLRHSTRRKLRRWMHITAPRCPHMGCPLHYNPATHQWECPCHGSSFDVFGQVLSAPASKDASLSPKDRPV